MLLLQVEGPGVWEDGGLSRTARGPRNPECTARTTAQHGHSPLAGGGGVEACLPGPGPTTPSLGAQARSQAGHKLQALGWDSKPFQRAVLRSGNPLPLPGSPGMSPAHPGKDSLLWGLAMTPGSQPTERRQPTGCVKCVPCQPQGPWFSSEPGPEDPQARLPCVGFLVHPGFWQDQGAASPAFLVLFGHHQLRTSQNDCAQSSPIPRHVPERREHTQTCTHMFTTAEGRSNPHVRLLRDE